uniref:Secreted protein n=1 Tax=Anguilla anguilla TaxID=7936 RepID=A0A0E9PVB4_ANGAN
MICMLVLLQIYEGLVESLNHLGTVCHLAVCTGKAQLSSAHFTCASVCDARSSLLMCDLFSECIRMAVFLSS